MSDKDKKPLVSVIMPSYNTPEEYLSLSIDSILDQTYENIELIVVDDGSESEYFEVLKKYSNDKLKIIRNEQNRGIVYSLNKAISIANGIYIARMDADDISNKQRIDKQVKYLENHRDISIVGAAAYVFGDSKGIKIKPSKNSNIKAQMLFENPIIHPVVMFRKKDFQDAGLEYESDFLSEDYALWFKALYIKGLKASNLKKVLLDYRRHSTQITTKNSTKLIDNNKDLLKYMFSQLEVDMNDYEIELYLKFANSLLMSSNEKENLNEILRKILKGNYRKFEVDYKSLRRMFTIKYLKEVIYQLYKNKDSLVKNFVLFLLDK